MSKKERTRYLCRDCGEDFPQWFGRCPSCQEWNTLVPFAPPVESGGGRATTGSLLGARKPARPSGFFAAAAADEPAERAPLVAPEPPDRPLAVAPLRAADPVPTPAVPPAPFPSQPPTVRPARGPSSSARPANPGSSPALHGADRADAAPALPTLLRLADVPLAAAPRVRTGIHEFDRVLGGGLVAGSVVLIGGDPGIGKSTLLLQAAGRLVAAGIRALYVTGEESAGQIRLRAERLRSIPPHLLVHTETNLEEVAQAVEELRPRVLIVDSIQTAYLPGVASAPGSVTQVREAALALIELAKRRGVCVLLVGHVTKDGAIAGPKTLEHMVDAVIYMEGERYQHYRILRSVKNRFGGVDELGVFQMGAEGLVEVSNPSQVFLSEHTAGTVGSVVATTVEGTRALLLEVQALVVPSQYANPQRVATGYDRRRLELLLAVLEKRTRLDLARRDVFVNIAGGLRVVEPGVDLGILLAVVSSATDLAPAPDLVVAGEVGLGGEIRRIAHPERRIQEMARLGYRRALLPAPNLRDLGTEDGVELIGVATVAEALETGLNSPAPLG